MTKEYLSSSSNWMYFVKLLILAGTLILFRNYLIILILLDFFIKWWNTGLGPVEYIVDFFTSLKNFFIGKRKIRYIIGFTEDQLHTRYNSYYFKDISSYGEARGGSEAFLMLNTNKRIDLETSWLTKEEQEEIALFLNNTINGQRQT